MTNVIRPSAICIAFLLLLIVCTTTTTHTKNARVIAENVTLRETPSNTGLAELQVPEGTVVKILDEKSPWFVVRVGDRVGWMHSATLLLTDDPATATREPEPVRVNTPPETYSAPEPTRPTSERTYIRGPRGGCYYISGSGRKVYVDRSMCN